MWKLARPLAEASGNQSTSMLIFMVSWWRISWFPQTVSHFSVKKLANPRGLAGGWIVWLPLSAHCPCFSIKCRPFLERFPLWRAFGRSKRRTTRRFPSWQESINWHEEFTEKNHLKPQTLKSSEIIVWIRKSKQWLRPFCRSPKICCYPRIIFSKLTYTRDSPGIR